MKPHYTTTLVVDFDDTIAITHNRDWTNATPNKALVTKLNALYADGWSIHIVTARGQLSCDGDCEAADRKYRSQIESWLGQHDVKYTSLCFHKKLAAYYIDDKGITPEQFVESFERTRLVGGWSGDSVYYDKVTDSVYKTSKNTQSVVRWFEAARWYGYNVPGVHSVIGDTIRMQYLNTYGGDITNVLETVHKFASHPPLQVEAVSTDSYIARCRDRVKDVLSLED
jgi:capsule biosynthesis phosphatase